MLLLGITVVSLTVALVMSVTVWRLMRDERRRTSARVAALSIPASVTRQGTQEPGGERQATKGLWAPAPLTDLSEPELQTPPLEPEIREAESTPGFGYARSFLETRALPYGSGSASRQYSLAIAAVVLFLGLSAGLLWIMSAPRGSTAAAMGPNMPLELVSLRHDRQDATLSVSGLVRNPLTGRPVERVSAMVLLFDNQGTFVTSATAPVDFVKLGVGDESPFVVSLAAPSTVARYRVSFRTDEGVVSHIDRRGAAAPATEAEQPASLRLK